MKLEQEKQFRASEEAVKSIVELYGLEFIAYDAASSGIENTTLIVTTKTQKVVMRIYRLGKKSTSEITQELHFMRFLHSGGLKVPQILANKQGVLITAMVAGGSHWQVIVMEFVAGEHAKSYTPELLLDIARTQAKMHLLSTAYTSFANETEEYTELKEDYFLPLINKGAITDKTLQQFLRRASNYTVKLDAELPKGLCHLDYDKDNIIAKNNAVVAVLDFDDMAIAPFVVCLGFTLWHIWQHAGKDMVEAYLAEYTKTRPLNTLENSYLQKVMLFRHYMICDLKILNDHIETQEIEGYINLEYEIIKMPPLR